MIRQLAVAVLMTVVLGACSPSAGSVAAPDAAPDTSISTPSASVKQEARATTSTTSATTTTSRNPSSTTSTSTSTTTQPLMTTTLPPTTTTAPATTTTTLPPTTTTAPATTTTTIDLTTVGQGVATSAGCTNCHSTNGSPGLGPTWSGVYGSTVPLDDGSTVTATASYLRESIISPNAKIVDGYFAGLMQDGYGSTLSAADIDAIIAYIASL